MCFLRAAASKLQPRVTYWEHSSDTPPYWFGYNMGHLVTKPSKWWSIRSSKAVISNDNCSKSMQEINRGLPVWSFWSVPVGTEAYNTKFYLLCWHISFQQHSWSGVLVYFRSQFAVLSINNIATFSHWKSYLYAQFLMDLMFPAIIGLKWLNSKFASNSEMSQHNL